MKRGLLLSLLWFGAGTSVFAQPVAKNPPKEEAPIAPRTRDNPAVLAVFESNPQTPAQLVRAIEILVNLDRTEMARDFIQRLLTNKLDDAQFAALVEERGSAVFVQLAADQQLPPELRAFSQQALRVAQTFYRDPAQIHAWIVQLGDPSEGVQQRARRGLFKSGPYAVASLVETLADAAQAPLHRPAELVLGQLDRDAIPPLRGLLTSGQESLWPQAAKQLARLGGQVAPCDLLAVAYAPGTPPQQRDALLELLAGDAGTPSPATAQKWLDESVRLQLDISQDPAQHGNQATIWRWDANANQLVPQPMRGDDVAIEIARLHSAALASLSPSSEPNTVSIAQRLAGIALLESAKRQLGYDQPLVASGTPGYEALGQLSPAVLNAALEDALDAGHAAAACGAVELLRECGDASLLSQGEAPTPLAKAANFYDARVRAAALRTLIALSPSGDFAGTSAVSQGLGYWASSRGKRRALILHPRTDLGTSLAGQLSELGILAEPITDWPTALHRLQATADVELIYLHMAMKVPAEEIVAQLRRDPRTASIPIAIIPHPNDLDRAERLIRRIAEQETVPSDLWRRAHTGDNPSGRLLGPIRRLPLPMLAPPVPSRVALEEQVAQLMAIADRTPIPGEVRAQHALWALETLARLSGQPNRYGVEKQQEGITLAVQWPPAYAFAVDYLGNLGNRTAQQQLTNLVATETLTLENRERAALAFRHAVSSHGVQLSKAEILLQYDRYNATEHQPAEVQRVAGIVLDTIENKPSPTPEKQ